MIDEKDLTAREKERKLLLVRRQALLMEVDAIEQYLGLKRTSEIRKEAARQEAEK